MTPADNFDPYRKWLGIAPEEQPPNHYRLLGVPLFEEDPDVIESAADARMAHLRTLRTGQRADLSQRLLNEVAAAKTCLLTPQRKVAYDAELRGKLATQPMPARSTGVAPPPGPAPAVPPPVPPPVGPPIPVAPSPLASQAVLMAAGSPPPPAAPFAAPGMAPPAAPWQATGAAAATTAPAGPEVATPRGPRRGGYRRRNRGLSPAITIVLGILAALGLVALAVMIANGGI